MQAKTMLTMLLTGALIASSAAVGYAGGGGAGGPGDTLFFQCYQASGGPKSPHVLEVNDQFIDPTVEKVGKLKFICSFNPTVTQVPDSPGVISQSPSAFDSITCYEAPGAQSKDVVTYTDHLFETPQTAKVGPSQVICVAACTNPNGC